MLQRTPPVVSVIMPTYNNIDVVGNAIQSVLDQTFGDWELIIVDDCSTDGTLDYVQESFSDARISIHRMGVNSGSGACRNFAIEKARGRYIAVLDADDECLPDRLACQVEAFRKNGDATVIASQVFEFGEWGGPVLGNWPTSAQEIRKRQDAYKMPVPHPSVMITLQALEEVGGYDTACRRAQDYALFLKLRDRTIVCLDRPLVRYRTRRPISLNYAILNQAYAELALQRFLLAQNGTPLSDLPVEPDRRFATVVRGVKSWAARTYKELFFRA